MRVLKSSARSVVSPLSRNLLPRMRHLLLAIPGMAILLACAATAHAQVKFLDVQLPVGGAGLATPGGIAADGQGNIYIADTGNNRILQLAGSAAGYGLATPVLGNLSAPAGIAADWYGNVYIADTGNNRILELPIAPTGFGSPITVASGLGAPRGVAVDSGGNIFVADTGNNRVVELPVLGTTFGSPVVIGSGFSAPRGIAVDTSRNLYIADTGNNRIVKETVSSGAYPVGQALISNLASPSGVAVDSGFDIFIAETGSHIVLEAIWAIGANRFNGNVVVGSGFTSPTGVAVDAKGNIWVADTAATEAWEVVSVGPPFAPAAIGTPSAVQIYNFSIPAGTTLGSIGIFAQGTTGADFADGGGTTCLPQTYAVNTACSVNIRFTPTESGLRTGAIVLYDPLGNPLITTYISGTGIGPRAALLPASQTILTGQLSGPSGVAVDGAGNIYIADTGNNRILELPASNGAYGSPITLPVIQLNTPMGMAIDGAGNLYIASNGNDKIVKFPWTGSGFGPQSKIPIAVYAPSAVFVDASGTLFIADTYDNRIPKLLWSGTGYTTARSPGSEDHNPMGVSADAQGNAYFTNPYQNNLVQVPQLNGNYQAEHNMVVNHISFPTAIVNDGNSNLYLLDTGNNRVVMFPWTGSGFGPQVTVASGFNAPAGMAIDSSGNLYVADTGNNQIVKINLAQPAQQNFASTYVGATSTDSARNTTVLNTGNLPQQLTSVAYPTDFPENPGSTNSCAPGDTITPGANCVLAIDFSPQSVGSPLQETVNISLAVPASDVPDPNAPIEGEFASSVPVAGIGLPQQPQSITFAPMPSVTYGTGAIRLSAVASSGLPITYSILSGPATLVYYGRMVAPNGAGTIVLQATQAGNLVYQPAPAVTITLTVAPATLTVTPANSSAVYGAIPSNFRYSISGFVLAQTAAQVVSGQPAIAVDAGITATVGAHSLIATQGTLQAANYAFAFVPGSLTVTRAALQITASPAATTYGSPVPALGWTLQGLVNGDSPAVVAGAPELTTLGNAQSAAGRYPITPSLGSLSAANYSFTFIAGTLTIGPATLTVTAQNQSMTYGAAFPTLTYTITGFLRGDSAASAVHGFPAVIAAANAHSSAGSYAITPSLGTLSAASYAFAFVPATLTISQAALTITASSATITYGQPVPALSYQVSGLLNGDTAATALKGAPALSTTATAATAPGTQTISVAAGTLTALNYTLSFRPGTLIIKPAVLTVTPANLAKTYGAANPAIPYTITGYVNGDTAAAISGAPVFTVAADPTSPAGKYPITGVPGTLASSLYTFTLNASTLTVNKALLTLTANPLTLTYGTPVPALTCTITGYLNGDTASAITGTPAATTTASTTPGVGNYAISVNTSQLTAANYTLAAVPATLTVAPATLTLIANPVTYTYGTYHPSVPYQFTGYMYSDTSAVLRGMPYFSTAANSTAPVGVYPVTATMGTLAASNYLFQLNNTTATITPAVLTVTARAATMTYGSAPPAFAYTTAGYLNGDNQSVLSGAPTLTTTASAASPAGVYLITPATGTLTAANYTFAFAPGQLTINPAAAKITANNQTMALGSTLPTLTYTVTGLLNGDTPATALAGTPTLTTTATTSSAVGTYPITVAAGSVTAANYTLSFANGTLTVTQTASSVFNPRRPPRRLP